MRQGQAYQEAYSRAMHRLRREHSERFRVLLREELSAETATPTRKRRSPEEVRKLRAKAKRLRERGKQYQEIGEALGINQATAWFFVNGKPAKKGKAELSDIGS